MVIDRPNDNNLTVITLFVTVQSWYFISSSLWERRTPPEGLDLTSTTTTTTWGRNETDTKSSYSRMDFRIQFFAMRLHILDHRHHLLKWKNGHKPMILLICCLDIPIHYSLDSTVAHSHFFSFFWMVLCCAGWLSWLNCFSECKH